MRLLYLIAGLLSWDCYSHQTSITAGGKPVHWFATDIPLVIRAANNDLPAGTAAAIIQSSIAEWNDASDAKILAASASVNEIRFVSDFPYGSGVLGLTEVSYNSAGVISSAVISINDDYQFTATPGLVTSAGAYLGDIVTHELGHFLGLSHSEVMKASLFYSSFSGQSTLSLDDKAAVRLKYGTGHGRIRGQVKGGGEVGVLGAHVHAVSRRSGDTVGAVSDEDGFFEIGGLDLDDTYYLYTSPLKNPGAFPEYFSNAQTDFCPASYQGSFFSACGKENEGLPQGITLTQAEAEVDVGTVTINCGLKVSEAYLVRKLGGSSSPLTVYDFGAEPRFEKAFVGFFRKSAAVTFSSPDKLVVDLSAYGGLSGTPKSLKVSLVSYPFGARLEYLLDVRRNNVVVASRSLAYSAVTKTYDMDLSALLPLSSTASENVFELQISSRRLDPVFHLPKTFPSYDVFSSEDHMPYLLVLSLWENTTSGLQPMLDAQPILSDNSSCLDAPFTYAVSKSETSNSENSARLASAAGASCGTIEPPEGPGSGGSGLFLYALGFLLALVPNLLSKTQKKFLS